MSWYFYPQLSVFCSRKFLLRFEASESTLFRALSNLSLSSCYFSRVDVVHVHHVNHHGRGFASDYILLRPLQDTVGQIKKIIIIKKNKKKRASEDTVDLRKIKKLKHSESHKFKRKPNKDKYIFNLKFGETLTMPSPPRRSHSLKKLNQNSMRFLARSGDAGKQIQQGSHGLVENQGPILLGLQHFFPWKEFTVCQMNETGFPTDPQHGALHLHHLLEQAQSPSLIESAFYSIK